MDPFATLGVERTFDLDLKALEKTHRELSRALHPDKYAAAGQAERNLALGRAQSVNEAWRVLRDPIRRAEALFELAGVKVGERHEPKPGQAFLMDILEMREALAEAKAMRDMARVRKMEADVQARASSAERALAEGFSRAGRAGDAPQLQQLTPKLGELRFYRRFLDEVSAIEDELVHGTA